MIDEIIKILKSNRYSLHNEKKLQSEIEQSFINSNIAFKREHRFNKEDICDFFITNGICLEIKISGSPKSIYRQLERYAQHNDVSKIILATNKTMGLPKSINGKDCYVVTFGENWL